MRSLFLTTSFRITVFSVLFFLLIEATLGLWIYQRISRLYVSSNDGKLADEMLQLTGVDPRMGKDQLAVYTLSSVANGLRLKSRFSNFEYILLTGEGRYVSGTISNMPEQALGEQTFFDFTVSGFDNEANENLPFRGALIRLRTPEGGPYFTLLLGYDNSLFVTLQNQFTSEISYISVLTICAGILLGLFFSQLLLRRIERINTQLQSIVAGDLRERLPVRGARDELEYLAAGINSMLEKLEKLMRAMRKVGDNIAHDLRSPLTRLKGQLQAVMTMEGEEKEEGVRQAIAELDTVLATFRALLSISRLEAGDDTLHKEKIDLIEVIREAIDFYEPLFSQQNISFEQLHANRAVINGSQPLLTQVMVNLFENILKYAATADRVRIETKRSGNLIILSVADNGPGMRASAYGKALERFYRAEKSRRKEGVGLGLALVKAIVSAHDGTVRLCDGLANAQGGVGLGIRVELPLVQAGKRAP